MSDNPEGSYISRVEAGEDVSGAVLRAVEAISERPILDLPPLAESVDVDALDWLFASSTSLESLRFRYEGYEVTVEPERVRIRERR